MFVIARTAVDHIKLGSLHHVGDEAAEDAQGAEIFRVRETDDTRLEGTHGKSRHGAAFPAAADAEFFLHKRDHICEELWLQKHEVHDAAAILRDGLHHAVAHDDGKWHGFSFCDEVIEDKLELTGGRPACLVLTVPVLEIENRERLVRLFFIGCRCVNGAALPLSGHRGVEVFPADTAMGYVFNLIKIIAGNFFQLLAALSFAEGISSVSCAPGLFRVPATPHSYTDGCSRS